MPVVHSGAEVPKVRRLNRSNSFCPYKAGCRLLTDGLFFVGHPAVDEMTYYTGIDVSLRSVSICVVDDEGEICLEAKVAAEIDAIVNRLRRFSSDVRAGDFVRGSFMPHAHRHLLTKRRPNRPSPGGLGSG
jgi:hypothetical protein